MTEQRKQEAEEYTAENFPRDKWSESTRFACKEGYLAACEKCEGEKDAYALAVLQWIFDNDISQLFPDQMLALYKERQNDSEQFKTHNNEHGKIEG